MKTKNTKLAAFFLMFVLTVPAFAQEPSATPTPTPAAAYAEGIIHSDKTGSTPPATTNSTTTTADTLTEAALALAQFIVSLF